MVMEMKGDYDCLCDCERVRECKRGRSYGVMWLSGLAVNECLRRGTLSVVGLMWKWVTGAVAVEAPHSARPRNPFDPLDWR